MKRSCCLVILLVFGVLLSALPTLAQEPTPITLWRHIGDLQIEMDTLAVL